MEETREGQNFSEVVAPQEEEKVHKFNCTIDSTSAVSERGFIT
jgi:hypothetical protein